MFKIERLFASFPVFSLNAIIIPLILIMLVMKFVRVVLISIATPALYVSAPPLFFLMPPRDYYCLRAYYIRHSRLDSYQLIAYQFDHWEFLVYMICRCLGYDGVG